VSCGKGFQQGTDPQDNNQSSESPNEPSPPTLNPSPPDFQFKPLLWEASRPGSREWSSFVFGLLGNQAQSILKAQDMDRFCPRYASLSNPQKINVAGQLISAMVKYESSFNPTTRLLETTLGTDSVTGQPVYSEGLLQLSYQDIRGYPFCEFDWEKDKNLSPTSPNKTIFNVYRNLGCGLRILANQVQRRGKIVLTKGAYWAVIKEDSRYEKIDEIANLVGNLEFCR
jgi:hypothetical protein